MGHRSDQYIDFTFDRHMLLLQDSVDTGADIGGNGEPAEAALLENQVDLISHFSRFL